MTLTDIISKAIRYAKKVIVTDNSSTVSASISQAGSGGGLSITTTAGTALKLEQNNINPMFGGTIEFFPPTGNEMSFDGGSDGRFSFANTSPAATKATIFSGANVGIGESAPATTLHVGGVTTIGRQDANQEGGEIILCRASDNIPIWSIDVNGGGINPFFRIYDRLFNVVRMVINSTNGNVGINEPNPVRQFHVNGTVYIQNLPIYANNSAALAGGLIANDVYKTATGELRIVV
jgi:hypothetical protein